MHYWNDSWFEANDDEFNRMISWFCEEARFYRLGGQIKEKYGTLRFYVQFHYQLHDLFYPGYCRIVWAKPLVWLDSLYMRLKYNPLRNIINHFQFMAYRHLYKVAIKKWPQFRKEIIHMADHKELFPLKLQREANENWYTSPTESDMLYTKDYIKVGTFTAFDTDPDVVWLRDVTGLNRYLKADLRFFNGLGVS